MRQYVKNQTPFRQRIVLSCILRALLLRERTNPFRVKNTLSKEAKSLLRTIHGDFLTGEKETWAAYDQIKPQNRLQRLTLDFFRLEDWELSEEKLQQLLHRYRNTTLTQWEEQAIFGRSFSEPAKAFVIGTKRPHFVIPTRYRKLAVA